MTNEKNTTEEDKKVFTINPEQLKVLLISMSYRLSESKDLPTWREQIDKAIIINKEEFKPCSGHGMSYVANLFTRRLAKNLSNNLNSKQNKEIEEWATLLNGGYISGEGFKIGSEHCLKLKELLEELSQQLKSFNSTEIFPEYIITVKHMKLFVENSYKPILFSEGSFYSPLIEDCVDNCILGIEIE